jgi:CDP-L-myo-inositol myo-inositolphosphotransferase
MGSEKSPPGKTVVVFESLADADRRVAGIAAAARIARTHASGQATLRLAIPGGGPLAAATREDIARLVEGTVEIWPAEQLDRRLRDADAPQAIAAPVLDEAEIMRATAKASDGPVARSLNRPLSQRLSRLLLRIPGLRPIHATAATAAVAVAMFVALIAGGGPGLIAGGLLFHAASVIDGIDGEVARATFRASSAGAALDSAIDAATNALFISGVTINLAARGNPPAPWLGIWGLGAFATGLLAIGWRTVRANRQFGFDLLKDEFGAPGSGLVVFLVGFVRTVTSRDFFAFLFALLIIADRGMAVLYIFATAATVWLLIVIASSIPARRQRSA